MSLNTNRIILWSFDHVYHWSLTRDMPLNNIFETIIVVSFTQQFNATNNTVLPIVVGNTEVSETESPIVVNRTSNVTTNIEEVVCVIDYKQELQGLNCYH